MSKLPHVPWLKAFEAAARHSSFSNAADELNLTPAAVSQQIRLLEQHINVQLFKRLPRGVELTPQGQAYAQPIRKAFQEMQNATTGLFEISRKRKIHVRASITYAALVLAPKLTMFNALHPDIEVHLSTAVWSDRIDQTDIDLDIRYGNGDWSEPNILQLGHEIGRVVCSPAHAASFGEGLNIHAIAEGRVVMVHGSEIEWKRLSEHFALQLPTLQTITKADSSLIALQILSGGSGASIIHENFAKWYIDQGLLACPFDYRLPIREAYYLVTPDRAQEREEVRALRDWLLAEYSDPETSRL